MIIPPGAYCKALRSKSFMQKNETNQTKIADSEKIVQRSGPNSIALAVS